MVIGSTRTCAAHCRTVSTGREAGCAGGNAGGPQTQAAPPGSPPGARAAQAPPVPGQPSPGLPPALCEPGIARELIAWLEAPVLDHPAELAGSDDLLDPAIGACHERGRGRSRPPGIPVPGGTALTGRLVTAVSRAGRQRRAVRRVD